MPVLEKIWEFLGLFFGGLVRLFEKGVTAVFGSENSRKVRRMQSRVDAINSLESRFEKMSDEELRDQTRLFRARLAAGESLDDLLVEAFAAVRESGKRFLNMRHYDVQLIGGMVLHNGAVAEMVTGEGKTLVATLPAYLNALAGHGVHVVTVNDYLARRDMEWMAPLYMGLGLTVDAIQSDHGVGRKQKAYDCDITYGTNNEFGFDYLRDNMRPAARGDDRYEKHYQQSQGKLYYAIIDEVDNILIDEARTPLIISGPAHQDLRKYAEADRIARRLVKGTHYQVNEKDRSATLTDEGVREAEKMAGVESFYTAGNMDWPHLIDNALRAHNLFLRDVNYVVKDGKVVIVDEFTGRLMEGRQWSDGLHQAVEAKEGVKVKEETQTLATITLQNYFKLYSKISGMTGTALTEAGEFWKIYSLDVIAIPTNRPMQRTEHPDTIYSTEKFKWEAVADEIEAFHRWDTVAEKNGTLHYGKIVKESDSGVTLKDHERGEEVRVAAERISRIQYAGRPVLIGTVSIEKSELLSGTLSRRGIPHEVLNAKHHKREAEIIAQAGRLGAVTIATNMAGRGTDIILGGNPETMAWARLQDKYETRLDVPRDEWNALVKSVDEEHEMSVSREKVRKLGGLHVIGTERHDARRIDLQLRGRCGRQGDPGSSRFFLSLDDDLMRIFAGPFVKRILEMGGFKDDVPIESSMVSRRIDSAQKKREEYNFEIRKNLLEYDEVMDEQRKRIYGFRQKILDGASCRDVVIDMIRTEIDRNLDTCAAREYGPTSFAAWAGLRLSTSLEPRQFRNTDFRTASEISLDEAERAAEGAVLAAIEENLPRSDDDGETESRDWNWDALAKFVNARWGMNLRTSDLKKVGRDQLDEFLIGQAREALRKTDLSEGAPMLEPGYNLRATAHWVQAKFGVPIDPTELEGMEIPAIKDLVTERAIARYSDRESEYPVMAGMYQFSVAEGNSRRVDREALAQWAARRFDAAEIRDELINLPPSEGARQLHEKWSRQWQTRGETALEELRRRIGELASRGQIPLGNTDSIPYESFTSWFRNSLNIELPQKGIGSLEQDALEQCLVAVVADHFHPEMRRMERMVLLDVVDNAWKDHLLAMDYLRSAVSQRGIAQLDPKVEYKREGMRLFETLWHSIGERVTDLIYRIEHLNPNFVSDTFVRTNNEAVHQQFTPSEMIRQQQAAINASSNTEPSVTQPFRNRKDRVGRNDPCPCGSGKKFKHCHWNKELES
jgi:preprotein translocase subunit SecA